MFSPLARGYGTWTGEVQLNSQSEVQVLPKLTGGESHRHDVTVSPRNIRSNTNYSLTNIKEDGEVPLPKTYITRKGALLLFTAPPDESTQPNTYLLHKKKVENLLDCSLKLNTLERLYLSALQYGDLSGYSKDKCSITDPDNQWFLKFLRGLDEQDIDYNTKPGSDINVYLRDLKTRASSRPHDGSVKSNRRQNTQELRELLQEFDGIWRSKTQNSLQVDKNSQGHKQRILSSKSLAASIKSSTYLGRSDSTASSPSLSQSTSSPVALPKITVNRHGSGRKTSWISSKSTTEHDSLHNDKRRPHSRDSTTTTLKNTNIRPDEVKSRIRSRYKHVLPYPELEKEQSSLENDEQGQYIKGSWSVHYNDFNQSDIVPSNQDIKRDVDATNINKKPLEAKYISEDLVTSEQEAIRLHGRHNIPDLTESIVDLSSIATSVLEEQDIILPSDGEDTILEFVNEQVEEWPGAHITTTSHIEQSDEKETELFEKSVKDQTVIVKDDDIQNDQIKDTVNKLDAESEDTVLNGDEAKIDNEEVKYNDKIDDVLKVDHNDIKTDDNVIIDDKDVTTNDKYDTKDDTAVTVDDNDVTVDDNDVTIDDKDTAIDDNDVQIQDKDDNGNTDDNDAKIDNRTNDNEIKIDDNVFQIDDSNKIMQKHNRDLIDTDTTKINNNVSLNRTEFLNKPSTTSEEEKDITQTNDDNESEQMSFVFIPDTSTSGSVSVGTRDPEEDIAEMLERRRRARLLSNFNVNNFSLEELEDDFAARAKEAEEAEKDFIFIRDVDSDGEAKDYDNENTQKVSKKVRPVKRKPKEKVYVKALDITSLQIPEDEQIIEEITNTDEDETSGIHPNQRFFPDGPLPKYEVPQEDPTLPSHLEEMLTRRSASKSAEELENELQQMQDIMNEGMSGAAMEVDEGEAGLTEEELKLAQELLEDKVKEVAAKIFNTENEDEDIEPVKEIEKKLTKKGSKGKKGNKRKGKKIVDPVIDRKKSIAEERDSIRQQRKLEKQKRSEEMRALQEKIAERENLRKAQEEETRRKAEELEAEQKALQDEAEAIKRNEEDARLYLAELRKNQRLEREAKRKAEQERKRQLAINRREREKAMREAARIKEKEMLERIADAETRKQLIEEEERRIEEEERLAQESFEEELREQQIALEEEELRMRELEKEAEEEAMQRLIEEREEAERRQRELREEEEKLKKEEELKRQALLIEEEKLREEKRIKELEELAKLEEERKRLEELKRMEEEAREAMKLELEYKREWALKRRENNLNRRSHLDKIRIGQGLTRPWVYSYFILWRQDATQRLMKANISSKTKNKIIQKQLNETEELNNNNETETMPGLDTYNETLQDS